MHMHMHMHMCDICSGTHCTYTAAQHSTVQHNTVHSARKVTSVYYMVGNLWKGFFGAVAALVCFQLMADFEIFEVYLL